MSLFTSDKTTGPETPGSEYLTPGYYMDSDHPAVISWTHSHYSASDSKEQQITALYYAVRDGFRYDPYRIALSKTAMKASHLLQRDHGYCIEKANLLGAAARVLGIASRLGFANVRNHIGTEKLQEVLKTDVLVFHGYVELWLNDKWVKATPAFNLDLCEKLKVQPLDFDGKTDSVFQQFDQKGGKFMEYLEDHGTFSDWPRDLFLKELNKHYGHLFHSFIQEPSIQEQFNEGHLSKGHLKKDSLRQSDLEDNPN